MTEGVLGTLPSAVDDNYPSSGGLVLMCFWIQNRYESFGRAAKNFMGLDVPVQGRGAATASRALAPEVIRFLFKSYWDFSFNVLA